MDTSGVNRSSRSARIRTREGPNRAVHEQRQQQHHVPRPVPCIFAFEHRQCDARSRDEPAEVQGGCSQPRASLRCISAFSRALSIGLRYQEMRASLKRSVATCVASGMAMARPRGRGKRSIRSGCGSVLPAAKRSHARGTRIAPCASASEGGSVRCGRPRSEVTSSGAMWRSVRPTRPSTAATYGRACAAMVHSGAPTNET
jgi:hypothetical protein